MFKVFKGCFQILKNILRFEMKNCEMYNTFIY